MRCSTACFRRLTLGAARDQLRSKGLLAQPLVETSDSVDADGGHGLKKRVNPRSLQIFSRQFATMIEAGLSVVAALTILEEQTDDERLPRSSPRVREDVEGGSLLSEAMAQHPKVFSRLYIAMVEAGEAAGYSTRCSTVSRTRSRRRPQIKRRVKGAMIYPTVVITLRDDRSLRVCCSSSSRSSSDLRRAERRAADADPDRHEGVEPARGTTGSSSSRCSRAHLRLRYAEGPSPAAASGIAFKLRVPMKIGDTVRKVAMARFSRTLSTLVGAGVDIIKALEITGRPPATG